VIAKKAVLEKALKNAAKRGDPLIFRGQILGTIKDEDIHLNILFVGPALIQGIVSGMRRSVEDEKDVLDFFVMNELLGLDGAAYQIPVGVRVTGAELDSLSDLRDGDRVSLEGRDTKHGYRATSQVAVIRPDETHIDSGDEPGL